MRIDPVAGDLVLWHSPEGSTVLGIVVHEETGHGGGNTGWFRILSSLGGRTKTYLTRAAAVEILTDYLA